ncbi:DUF454 domain-containing protein [Lysobacter pythonis]|uniref:Inner membrane protein n=1 Tax=Solilutibacter pythonis TaxID=2483112 RepID=A0A3M2HQV7_9GAMM|nr:YbaN family protein [Lysobacter pythonis]RMH90735.1 DUF454 domain-containing protein [Lysobacter pythonis]
MRTLWLALGWLMVALGFIGALLPVMPTTIFLLLALACFTRSSPRLQARLLAHPRYGQTLRDWHEEGAISRRGKRYALAGMALGFALFIGLTRPPALPAFAALALLLAGAVFVATRPLPQRARPPDA